MKDVSIRQRILGSFGIILGLTAIAGWLIFYDLHLVRRNMTTLETDSVPGLLVGAELRVTVEEGFLRVARHATLTEAHEIQANRERILDLRTRRDELMGTYEKLIAEPAERSRFESLKTSLEPFRMAVDAVLGTEGQPVGPAATAAALKTVDASFEQVDKALKGLTERNIAHNREIMAQVDEALARTREVLIAAFAILTLLCLLSGVLLFRSITLPLKRLIDATEVTRQGDFTRRIAMQRRDELGVVSDGFDRMIDELAALIGQVKATSLQVTTSVTQVAASAREQQATATEIASTTAEIGSTSREITATSRHLVKTMKEVAESADQSAVQASESQSALTQMGETMRNVIEATGAITAKLTVLNEKASNINQVVTTISKVADQTNLLSLNAAIEAEKAGEFGRGFAVVSSEIRRLADQTAVATFDIEQIVKEIQSAVASSVMGMDKFSEEVRRGMQEVNAVTQQLHEIINQVQALAPRFDSVNEGMQAQADGADQITQALQQLTESAQQTVQALRQSNEAIDGLNQVAITLRGGVSRFRLREEA
ncbi:methyl-accepting chemotaxis protein [Tahibacter amnicola]|uniref:Methyl-accepting chemotaxis protein n=1 Tax=Tahibacter amnicola TaxID=2976241 RepID=A0ABY6BDD8_9GAMM|nr:methyl-accepting chemotaxis protein [Tahibacter amnicola]UXI68046.1 methyl-accepting chemotaxis protein [Tahibacter amnicola]